MSTTMRIRVNGLESQVATDITLAVLLHEAGIDAVTSNGIAVAVNETVVPRGQWATLQLRADDSVEIVRAVQGG